MTIRIWLSNFNDGVGAIRQRPWQTQVAPLRVIVLTCQRRIQVDSRRDRCPETQRSQQKRWQEPKHLQSKMPDQMTYRWGFIPLLLSLLR